MTKEAVTRELNKICSKIAGKWHSEDGSHSIDFTPVDRLLKETPVELIDNGNSSYKTTYIIGINVEMPLLNETKFYFEVGKDVDRKKYLIKEITKEKMVATQLEGYTEQWGDVTYIKNK